MKERTFHNCALIGDFLHCIGGYNQDGPRDLRHISGIIFASYFGFQKADSSPLRLAYLQSATDLLRVGSFENK